MRYLDVSCMKMAYFSCDDGVGQPWIERVPTEVFISGMATHGSDMWFRGPRWIEALIAQDLTYVWLNEHKLRKYGR